MGMLETRIKRVPEGKDRNETARQLRLELENYFSDYDNSCEDFKVDPLTSENFDEVWTVQETYKNTPEIKEKYRGLAKEGKLVYVEIDW
jgi:hypothetical protein